MWAYESVFYQIYPLGFSGAPFENDGVLTSRMKKLEIGWAPMKILRRFVVNSMKMASKWC